jgi:hypothetical protein
LFQFLKGQYRKRATTVVLPDGRRVLVSTTPTGVAIVNEITDGDVMHAIVQPATIQAKGFFGKPKCDIKPDDAEPLNLKVLDY